MPCRTSHLSPDKSIDSHIYLMIRLFELLIPFWLVSFADHTPTTSFTTRLMKRELSMIYYYIYKEVTYLEKEKVSASSHRK